MQRFTVCGLRAYVDYVNEVVPKIDGKHFAVQSAYGRHRIILKGDGGEYGTAAEDTHINGGTPRYCVHAFHDWLVSSTCSRGALLKLSSYMIKHNI